ncbi:MAG TPA: hypothetical protein VGR98_28090 [Streptosporangiaceae bacterium]|nr:hypothetical protein [Streptosporangiaceae bacterium]
MFQGKAAEIADSIKAEVRKAGAVVIVALAAAAVALLLAAVALVIGVSGRARQGS